MRPFAEQLLELTKGQDIFTYLEQQQLDADAHLALLDRALERFELARPGLEPDDAAAQRAALDGLIEWIDELLLRVEIRELAGLSAASLEYAMGIGADEVPAAELERLEQLSRMGVGFYEGDEATEGATLDYAGLRERLSPALSDQGRAYLVGLSALEDETGVASPAQLRLRERNELDASAQLSLWTTMREGAAGDPWGAEARAQEVLSSYLSRGASYEHTYFVECVISPELRASYEAFIAAHPDTPEADAVETFLLGAKVRGYRLTKERQFDALLELAMSKVER